MPGPVPTRISAWILAWILVPWLAAGCALPAGTTRMATTHYVDPDERAVPRKPASGQSKKLCGIFFVTWAAPDAAMMEAAIADALADDPGATLLVNAQTDASIYLVPLLFARCRVFVTGTTASTTPRTTRDDPPTTTGAPDDP